MRKALLLFLLLTPVLAFTQSIDSLNAALQYHVAAQDTSSIERTIKPLANALRAEKKYGQAAANVHTGLKWAFQSESRLSLLSLLGQIYIEMTDYDSAMSQYTQLLRESEKAGNLTYQGFALNNIGYIYYQNDDFKKATEHHRMALAVRQSDGNKKWIGTSYNNLGLVLFQQDSLEKSLAYYNRALEMFREAEYRQAEANVLNNIGNIYLRQGKLSRALSYHEMSLNIREQIDDLRGVAESHKNIARIFIAKEEYKLAERSIETGMKQALDIASQHLIKEFYLIRYELAEKRRDYQKALSNYKSYAQIRDSLTGLESQNRIAEIEIQYEVAKKEQEFQILSRDKQIALNELKIRNYLLIGVIILFLLSLIILMLFIRQNKLQASLRIEQQKQQLQRSQMNPHFMYNALSAIQNFILQNNPMDSISYISDFSGLMRLVLEGSRNETVPLSDDINLVQSYLRLQQLRFNDAFEYQVDVSSDIVCELMAIPPMLSQPFIENAVEHGMRQLQSRKGMIHVSYEKRENALAVSIIDNGPGIQKTAGSKKHKSLASSITRERLDSIYKTIGINIQMEITSNEDVGTKVVFLIPQKTISK